MLQQCKHIHTLCICHDGNTAFCCPVDEVMQANVQHPLSTVFYASSTQLVQVKFEAQVSHCEGTVTSMPQNDHAAQLQCIGRAPVCQMREIVQQLPVTICPVEHMPHHLCVMQLKVSICQQTLLSVAVCLPRCSACSSRHCHYVAIG